MEESRLGQYRLIERLGAGGMGEVFLASLEREEGFKKLLVVKRILPELSESTRFTEMFSAEARIAARLNHPNIVHVTDFGRIGRNCYLAMEYVDGSDLSSLIAKAEQRRTRLTNDFVAAIGLGCLRALGYAHRLPEPVIHGDVSPSNVLVGRQGEVKITDFGLARLRTQSPANDGSREVRGKLCYMPPEVAFGNQAEERSDIFGVGAVLYETLAGVPPLPPVSRLTDALEQAKICMIPSLGQVVPEANPALVQIVDRALNASMNERFESASEMESAIERMAEAANLESGPRAVGSVVNQILGSAPDPAVRDVPRTLVAAPAVGRKRLSSGLWLVTLMLLAVLTGFALWHLANRNQSSSESLPDAAVAGGITKTKRAETEPVPEPYDGGISIVSDGHDGHADTSRPRNRARRFRKRKRLASLGEQADAGVPDAGAPGKEGAQEGPDEIAVSEPQQGFVVSANRPASIIFDTKTKQFLPFELEEKLSGVHVMKFSTDDELQVTIRAETGGQEGDLVFAFQSRPFAILSIDGSPKGLTPLGNIRLGRGKHVFTLAVPKRRPLVLRMNLE